MTYDVQWSDDLSTLGDPQWESLTRGVPFRSAAWLEPWMRHLGPQNGRADHTPAILTARRDGRLVGALPLYRRHGGRTLAAIGDGNTCTDYVSILAAADDQLPAIAHQMGLVMAQQSKSRQPNCPPWNEVDIDGIVGDDIAIKHWVAGLRDGGCRTHTESRMSVWRKPKDVDWPTHLKHHGKTQRRRMRRWSEKFETIPGATRLRATDPQTVRRYLDFVIDMHQRRWNDSGEAGTFAEPKFRDFIRDAALRMLESGQLHLIVMAIDGHPVAGDLNFLGSNRVLYCYSAGYDIEHADIEPGRILTIDHLREMYRRDEFNVIDFLRGNEEYKARFSTDSQPLYRLRVFAPSNSGVVRFAANGTAFGIKQAYRNAFDKNPATVAAWA